MNGKSPDAFRTISEVADWLGVNTHVLRFWESKFTQVKPIKRAGGRRYYRPADMELLGGIQKLLHDEGMTIKGVQKVLRDQGVRAVSAMSKPVEPSDGEPMEENAAPDEIAEPTPLGVETPQPVEAAEAVPPAMNESDAVDDAMPAEAPADSMTDESVGVQAKPFVEDEAPDAPRMEESALPHTQVDTEAMEPDPEIPASVSEIPPQGVSAMPPDEPAASEAAPEPVAPAPPEAFEETVPAEAEAMAQAPAPEASVQQPETAPSPPPEPAPEPEVASIAPPEPATASPTMPLFSRRLAATDEDVDASAEQDIPVRAPEAKGPIIAPLPPADISLTEALDRLQPLQVSPALLAPIHSRMLALRERMDEAR
ncbi:MerR family transcriptional regulator [Tropicimonas sp. TH_r6]|uniref:MerR family transcriptional regulator n=1 Tax=Tropicimonas sp. TH_r6 TaxID=3082085 RepID=UPI00295366DB|nr:MerR family transcriptional regulator [Tropicimonas sp. TH_r6]MDV7144431.1 MerR family transcriptional regulator [Tropicimonas sp. TH_r6]